MDIAGALKTAKTPSRFTPVLHRRFTQMSTGLEKSMKTVINQSGEFTQVAQLRPLETPKGYFHLSFQSTWGDAKDFDAPRTLFQVTTNTAGLAALHHLLDGAITASTH
jgi:hypothetical protein